MFLFKKIVGPLFLPLTLSLILMMAGLILTWFQKKKRLGNILLIFGILVLAFLSYNAVADRFIAPLECRYPPIRIQDAQGVRWILVLGGGSEVDDRYSPASRLSGDSLSRLAEGIRLYRKMPDCKLLFSGGAVFSRVSEAQILSGAARDLGVSGHDIILESASKDTEEQARMVRDIVGTSKFILVTSAFHMPRAMALFQKTGTNPVAAPAGLCARQEKKNLSPDEFYPNAEALQKSERALHEYLGIVWAKLRGKL
jgi:uncharacterized SAM-binding protein YcdF (DUF218 family)